LFHPHWAIVPDVGTPAEQDAIPWPFPRELSGKVYHQWEPLDRLREILDRWPRICLAGNVNESPGTDDWRRWMDDCWRVIRERNPVAWVHMLRALNEASVGDWPFASADSATWARHHAEYGEWKYLLLHAMNCRNPKIKIEELQSYFPFVTMNGGPG
jgi:hypothetical protein